MSIEVPTHTWLACPLPNFDTISQAGVALFIDHHSRMFNSTVTFTSYYAAVYFLYTDELCSVGLSPF